MYFYSIKLVMSLCSEGEIFGRTMSSRGFFEQQSTVDDDCMRILENAPHKKQYNANDYSRTI